MRLKPFIIMCALTLSACATYPPVRERAPDNWAVYYGTDASPEQLVTYDLLVLDSTYHPPLDTLDQPRQVILGYVSVGEATPAELEAMPHLQQAVMHHNDTWNSYVMDLNNPAWRAYLLEQRFPAIAAKGFDGFMLDTLDSPLYHQTQQADRFADQRGNALAILKALRAQYPEHFVMLNRGFAAYPWAADYIDASLAESVLAHYNLRTQEQSFFADHIYGEYVQKLQAAKAQNPMLRVYTLDYWSPSDAKGIHSIYNTQRRNGFHPYVSTPDLKQLYPQVTPVRSVKL